MPIHIPSQKLQEILGDFRVFLYHVWMHQLLPVPTPSQYEIGEYLQHGPKRRSIMGFRGVGKTWITATYVLWRLLKNQEEKILIVSASKAFADNTSTFIQLLMATMPLLQHLMPTDDQRTSKVSFDVRGARPAQSPSVRSVGITGQIAGSRASIIIADDIETPGNSETQQMRDKIRERVKEFDAVLMPGGEVIYLGTPQIEESLYMALEARGYATRIWPALYPDAKLLGYYGDRLAPRLLNQLDKGEVQAGDPTDPVRFDKFDLAARQASYGPAGFQLQFMLNTQLSDAERFQLKLQDLMFMGLGPDLAPPKVSWGRGPDLCINDIPNVGLSGDRMYRPMWVSGGEWGPYTSKVMFIDPAGRGTDETAYAVVGHHNGLLYCLGAGGFQDGFGESTLVKLSELAHTYGVNKILVEGNFGGGMFTELLKPVLRKYHLCSIEETWSKGQKEKRIVDTLGPVMRMHRLVINFDLLEDDYRSVMGYSADTRQGYRLFYQLTRMTTDRGAVRHDDRVEALAGAVGYFTREMALDVDQAVSREEEAFLEADIEDFIKAFELTKSLNPKGKSKGASWVSLKRR